MSIASCGLGHDEDAPQRALYPPRDVERILSISHAQLYRLIGRGLLDARKIGRSTFITVQSIEEFLNGLPPAQVREPEPVANWSPATGRGRGRPRKASPAAPPPTLAAAVAAESGL